MLMEGEVEGKKPAPSDPDRAPEACDENEGWRMRATADTGRPTTGLAGAKMAPGRSEGPAWGWAVKPRVEVKEAGPGAGPAARLTIDMVLEKAIMMTLQG